MKRTQMWCDAPDCGRLIQDKHTPKGFQDFDSTAEAWEFWSPKDDHDGIYCSLVCLIQGATELLNKIDNAVPVPVSFPETGELNCENN